MLHLMMRNKDKMLRVEEVEVPEGSSLVGSRLADTGFRKMTELLVIATREKNGEYKHNPGPDFVLRAGATLIVLAEIDDVIKLRLHLEES